VGWGEIGHIANVLMTTTRRSRRDPDGPLVMSLNSVRRRNTASTSVICEGTVTRERVVRYEPTVVHEHRFHLQPFRHSQSLCSPPGISVGSGLVYPRSVGNTSPPSSQTSEYELGDAQLLIHLFGIFADTLWPDGLLSSLPFDVLHTGHAESMYNPPRLVPS
jgi:hypothetical protein